jgi:hypothetical protein
MNAVTRPEQEGHERRQRLPAPQARNILVADEGSDRLELPARLDATDEDRNRGFNRTENLRAIQPSDPDFQPLFGAATTSRASTAASTTRSISAELTAAVTPGSS